ncbi:radial spoke head protein 6 homolog A-like [Rhodnius prolixus]
MDDEFGDDDSSPTVLEKSAEEGNEWDKEAVAAGEFRGEYAGEHYQYEDDLFGLERFESADLSDNKLEILKDPKLIMMEKVKNVLYNLITDRPENVIDYFEEYVRYLSLERGIPPTFDIYTPYFDVQKLLEEHTKWTEIGGTVEQEVGGEGAAMKRDYIVSNRLANFEDAGISLTKLELYGVAFAVDTVPQIFNLETVRFWGKIFGLYKNYYIIEANVTRDILSQDRNDEREKKRLAAEEKEYVENEEEDYHPKIGWNYVRTLVQYVKPPLPKSKFKPRKYAPKERLGTGLNKKIYYVSNEPSSGYVRLPDVTPVQIVKARQIKRFFTGILDQEISTDPPFPGNESNYLRAQIARISAGTQISPLGFYSFDFGEAGYEDEEVEEEGEFVKMPKPDYAINPDFEPIPLQDLVDPSMAFWVHHNSHILPQGRAVWVDPNIEPRKLAGEGEEEGEAKKEEIEKAEREVGPPLLTAASDDMNLEMIPPWSTRLMMDLSPFYSGAFVRSNLWLGAFTFGLHNEILFDNIYVGWGLKHNADSFTPVPYFIPQKEYEIGPEVTEITDPDPEEEDYEEILYRRQLEEEMTRKKEEKMGFDEV